MPRDLGRVSNYLEEADHEICVLAQVETLSAIDRPEAIVGTDGVDGVFIGPSDLSTSMGHIGNPQHPDLQRVIQDAVKRITAAGKTADILAPLESDARRYIEQGYQFVATGSDLGILAKAADSLADKARTWFSAGVGCRGYPDGLSCRRGSEGSEQG